MFKMTEFRKDQPEEERNHVLIVDDDDRIRLLLKKFLQKKKFRVSTAHNSQKARHFIKSLIFDIMVFDIMMPNEDGLSLLKWKNTYSETPVLLLTALGQAEDRIKGLEIGADDYLVKPFEPDELALRLLVIIKRSKIKEEQRKNIKFGAYSFNLQTHELYHHHQIIKLTSGETSLMLALCKTPGKTINRHDLVENGLNNRALDIHITRLRKKIEANPKTPKWLQTVRGKGYRLITELSFNK